jgi:ATPase family associated with various cellular activities (AAA)/Domain of unknown function (DUF5925)
MTKLLIDYDLADGDLRTAVFVQRGLERALRFHASDTWNTDRQNLEELVKSIEGDLLLDSHEGDEEAVVLDLAQCVLKIELERRANSLPIASVELLAGSRRGAKLELARLRELLPPAEAPPSDLINVGFWYRSDDGPRKVRRRLEAPGWIDSGGNYPKATRHALEPSMADVNEVISGGRLILWHGPPGTGKTSALRTLARENRDGLGLEYVLDPEALFGRDAGYFVNVLFNEDDEGQRGATRLLVLEDCDELLSADAKERAGQGLARLLNLVDGLIGQGLKLSVLITTNEPLSGFHPAVSRPGRCGAMISFELFSRAEAADWLAARGSPAPAPDRSTLAELFAIGEDRAFEGTSQRQRIGFVARSFGSGRA